MALHAPEQYVDTVLAQRTQTLTADLVSQRYGENPPRGFQVAAAWGDWVVYQRQR